MPTVHQCKCDSCQQSEFHPDQAIHHQMNLFMSRLDEQQRRWYAALEAKKQEVLAKLGLTSDEVAALLA